jgi:hypothetical protein
MIKDKQIKVITLEEAKSKIVNKRLKVQNIQIKI